MPVISVIIPAYNRAAYLEAAASSVLGQTYSDLELIIVDDGSTDATRDVCMALFASDARVSYICQDNRGPSAARNTGIRAAHGEFLAFLDADDRWDSTKLEKQLSAFEAHPEAGVVYCDWAEIDDSEHVRASVHPPSLGFPSFYENLLYNNIVHGSASAVLIRAECFARAGLFDESVRRAEDWEMWLRIARHFHFVYVPEVLVCLLQHAQQSQRNLAGMADGHVAVARKLSTSIDPQHRGHLSRARWHNLLLAAELYSSSAQIKSWSALWSASVVWPVGLLSLRTWYVLALSLAGPLHSHMAALGLKLRATCRRRLGLNSVTGWR